MRLKTSTTGEGKFTASCASLSAESCTPAAAVVAAMVTRQRDTLPEMFLSGHRLQLPLMGVPQQNMGLKAFTAGQGGLPEVVVSQVHVFRVSPAVTGSLLVLLLRTIKLLQDFELLPVMLTYHS